jgi:hypothetical protein
MSIGSSLSALQTAKADIADAIEAKGGTVGAGDGFRILPPISRQYQRAEATDTPGLRTG